MTAVLEVTDLRVRLGGADVVRGVSLAVGPGRVLGLVGPNGAGKTTLVDAVTGFVPASGAVTLSGRRVDHLPPHRRVAAGMARTFQTLELFEDLSVGENLAVAAHAGRGRGRDAGAADRAAALAGVAGVLDLVPAQLPPGRRKAVAMARALAAGPRVLLLDEPAAGLDGGERAALAASVRAVADAGTAVVLVDHDVGLVMDVCDEAAVLVAGEVAVSGLPSSVRGHPATTGAWLGPDVRAPGTAPGPAAAPALRASRERSEVPVLELRGLAAGWGGAPAVRGLDLTVDEGEVVALLGANGAGKTTTLVTVAGALAPLAGSATVDGRGVAGPPDRMARRGVSHAPQDRGVLGSLTVAEQLRLAAGGGRGGRAAVDQALDRLPALRPLLRRPAGVLSGGEQQQLSLARAAAARPRLLLVDELSLGLSPEVLASAAGLVRALADEGVAVLVVEQFAAVALSLADRAYVLRRGEVVASGPAAQVASRPETLADAYLGPVSGPSPPA